MTDFEMYPVAMSLLSVIPLLFSLLTITITVVGVLPAPIIEEGEA